jgi:hypothetical protein
VTVLNPPFGFFEAQSSRGAVADRSSSGNNSITTLRTTIATLDEIQLLPDAAVTAKRIVNPDDHSPRPGVTPQIFPVNALPMARTVHRVVLSESNPIAPAIWRHSIQTMAETH